MAVIIGLPPIEAAAKTGSTSSGDEQKLARGDLWKRPQYTRKIDDAMGGNFHGLLNDECHKLGFDISEVEMRRQARI